LDYLLYAFTYRFFKTDCFEFLNSILSMQLKNDYGLDPQSKKELELIFDTYNLKGIEYIARMRNQIPIWMQYVMIEIIGEQSVSQSRELKR
jgi:hypothetical protein